ncbi:MAG TPA: serine hydrolase domain-containing protein, partial [Chitinophagales bacterium]|nr:serine hydrolase domain-containing protein [Chitinophagales bacterium]HNL08058.1 serine hydrolase domain-containing protein [Chitinophagales bacterium]
MNKAVQILRTVVIVLISLSSASGQTNPNPNSSVDALILDEMDTEHFPGVSTVIVKNNKIVWIESYGFADVANSIPVRDTTVFLLASVSKVFTGTAAMQLVENNVIDLDDDVNQYLPWTLQIPGFTTNPVTFKQLMTHTSSIEDNDAVMDTYYDYPDPSITLPDCMQRYFATNGSDYSPTANFLPNTPGSVYEYSNIATALNGYLVELASGMPFDQYCNVNIFDKLCMDKTSWFFADFNEADVARPYAYSGGNYVPYPHYGFADYPDGQLRSNVVDMANFMIAYLNGGTLNGNSILSPAAINQMWTPQIPSLDPTQGLNWYQEELYHSNGTSLLWGHNGGENGVSTELYLDPINKIGICVLTNGEGDALFICDELYDYALNLSTTSGISPACLTTSLDEVKPLPKEKTLIKIIDLLGRETELKPNTPLIKIYSDGSTEKVYIMK